MESKTRCGIYYYPWYNAKRWKQHAINHRPVIGYYDSSSDLVIDYHTRLLKDLEIDYLVIEFLPFTDWAFEETLQSTKKLIHSLNKKDIAFSFLIDNWLSKENDNFCSYIQKQIEFLEKSTLTPTLRDENNIPIYFSFNPHELDSSLLCKTDLKRRFFFPTYVEDWNWTLNDFENYRNFNLKENSSRYDAENLNEHDRKATVKDVFEKNNHFQFWSPTENMYCMNGFCGVIPGYNDLLLKRNPQRAPVVERKNGLTLIEQCKKAQELGAKEIVFYSWNEFFEATEIEPTIEYGTFYYDLIKNIIKKIHSSKEIIISDYEQITSAQPKYLSETLKTSAQKYPDKLPRWDYDYYRAEVSALTYIHSCDKIKLSNVRVTNTGILPWDEDHISGSIRLGLRVYDLEGVVVSEGRANFPVKSLAPDESCICNIEAETPRLPAYVSVGVVWENRFWFDDCNKINITQE